MAQPEHQPAAAGIKIYTIGAGAEDTAPYPVTDVFGRTVYTQVPVEIDEELLQTMAEQTGGMFFRATDGESLKDVYRQIDEMEKTQIEFDAFMQHRDMYPVLIVAALGLLLVEAVASQTVLRRLP